MRPSFEFIKEKSGNNLVGVEVGVNKGDNAEDILKGLDLKKLYLVDIWDKRAYYIKHGGILTDEKMYISVCKRFKDYDNVEIIRAESILAAGVFGEKTLDFVYIDAGHSYENCRDDMHAWASRVKEGGVVAGDDYNLGWQGVIKAVKEYEEKHKVKIYQEKDDWWFVK